MSPTRRDVLKASAGAVTAALVHRSPQAQAEYPNPTVVAVAQLGITLKMSDGSPRGLFGTNHPSRLDGPLVTVTEYHPAHQRVSEDLSPELAQWSMGFITAAAAGVMKALEDSADVEMWP